MKPFRDVNALPGTDLDVAKMEEWADHCSKGPQDPKAPTLCVYCAAAERRKTRDAAFQAGKTNVQDKIRGILLSNRSERSRLALILAQVGMGSIPADTDTSQNTEVRSTEREE